MRLTTYLSAVPFLQLLAGNLFTHGLAIEAVGPTQERHDTVSQAHAFSTRDAGIVDDDSANYLKIVLGFNQQNLAPAEDGRLLFFQATTSSGTDCDAKAWASMPITINPNAVAALDHGQFQSSEVAMVLSGSHPLNFSGKNCFYTTSGKKGDAGMINCNGEAGQVPCFDDDKTVYGPLCY